jgi:hypothetical protein
MGHNGPRGFKKYDYKRKGSPILKKCTPIQYEKNLQECSWIRKLILTLIVLRSKHQLSGPGSKTVADDTILFMEHDLAKAQNLKLILSASSNYQG